jgi:hypothetical protein
LVNRILNIRGNFGYCRFILIAVVLLTCEESIHQSIKNSFKPSMSASESVLIKVAIVAYGMEWFRAKKV